jgi:serine/threonine protein kinase
MTQGLTVRDFVDLADDYEMIDEIGRGASAVVYRARDLALDRLVAIKVVRPQASGSGDAALERLAREARTSAKLTHPNIVTLYAVRQLHAAEGLALVMQLVPGGTVKDALEAEGALAPARAEAIVQDVASALAYAHARGVVHRDVKPENIFLDQESGRAMLADFGIAWSRDQDSRLTMTGAALGTPMYMAPEQLDGAPPDGRSDLYSLGLVAWEMLTGERPWAGESLFNLILKQKTEALPPMEALRPGVIPDRLQYVVERLLEKPPEARWAGADALLDALRHWVVPADFAPWLQARRRRAEAYAGQVAASPRGPQAPASDAATMVLARDTARSDPQGLAALSIFPTSDPARYLGAPSVADAADEVTAAAPGVADWAGGDGSGAREDAPARGWPGREALRGLASARPLRDVLLVAALVLVAGLALVARTPLLALVRTLAPVELSWPSDTPAPAASTGR